MLTRDDLIDLIVRRLMEAVPSVSPGQDKGAQVSAPHSLLSKRGPISKGKRRIFLSEHEIKNKVDIQNKRLVAPKEAILSPLALDWLILRGIEIVRE